MTSAHVEFILGALMNVGCAVATVFSDYLVLLMHRFKGRTILIFFKPTFQIIKMRPRPALSFTIKVLMALEENNI